MVDRYSRQIQDNGPPGAAGQNFADAHAFGIAPAAALGQLGDQAQQTLTILNNYQDKQDNLDLMAASNDYIKRINSELYDPETGMINLNKLRDARGMLMTVEQYADSLTDDIASRLNEKTAARFRLAEPSMRQPFVNSVASYEVKETEKFADAEAENTLQGLLEMVRSDPASNEKMEMARDVAAIVIANRMPGASEEMINSALASFDSTAEAARISTLIDSQPEIAEAWAKNSQLLNEKDRSAILSKTEGPAMLRRNQRIVDELVKFGTDDLTVMRVTSDIRDNYEGEAEEKLVSLYRSRIAELKYNEANATESRARIADTKMTELYNEYYKNNKLVPEELIRKYMADDILSYTHAEIIKRWNSNLSTFSVKMKEVNEDPNWRDRPEPERHLEAAKRFGHTEDQMIVVFEALKAGIMSGITTQNEITDYYTQGFLSKVDREVLTEMQKKYVPEMNRKIKSFTDSFMSIMEGIGTGSSSLTKAEKTIAKNTFLKKIDEKFDFTKGDPDAQLRDIIEETISELTENGEFTKAARKKISAIEDIDSKIPSNVSIERFASPRSTAESITFTNRNNFVEFMKESAVQPALDAGLFPSVVIAMAIHESRFGTGKPGNNLFGIKATGWSGDKTTQKTKEMRNGVMVDTVAEFRKYGTVQDSINDYIRMLSSNTGLYKNIKKAKTPEEAIGMILDVGYATDDKASYTRAIMRYINDYNLTRYDNPNYKDTSPSAGLGPQKPIEESFMSPARKQDVATNTPEPIPGPATISGISPKPVARPNINDLITTPQSPDSVAANEVENIKSKATATEDGKSTSKNIISAGAEKSKKEKTKIDKEKELKKQQQLDDRAMAIRMRN